MKTTDFRSLAGAAAIGSAALLFSVSAIAHEPEKHASDAEAPDCAAMMDMNAEEMDQDDPVVQAMMEQCRGHMDAMDHGNGSDGTSDHADRHGGQAPPEPSRHEH